MGGIKHLQWSGNNLTDMRLVILAHLNANGFFEIVGVGFGWKAAVYYDPKASKLHFESMAAILTDGIDF